MIARVFHCLALACALTLSACAQAAAPQVSESKYFTVVIKSDGTLWTWGRNDYGQLGDGTTTDRLTPVQIGTAGNWALVSTGTGENPTSPRTVALKSDGTLWTWGRNESGQLGDGTTADRLSPVQNWGSDELDRGFRGLVPHGRTKERRYTLGLGYQHLRTAWRWDDGESREPNPDWHRNQLDRG